MREFVRCVGSEGCLTGANAPILPKKRYAIHAAGGGRCILSFSTCGFASNQNGSRDAAE